MLKIPLIPSRASYQVGSPRGAVRSVELDGGASYMRRGVLNGARQVSVSFVLDPDEYDLLCGFYRIYLDKPQFFLMDLIIDHADLEEYQITFVPDTFRLTSQAGLSYTVSATLEVRAKPIAAGDDLGRARAIFVGIYGSEREGKRVAMDPLYETVNVIMPLNEADHVN